MSTLCFASEGWDLTFKIASAIGSLATFGAFLLLFRRDKDKQNQIDQLAGIAGSFKSSLEVEKQKVRLSVKPDITHNGGSAGIDRLTISLRNKSKYRAEIIKVDTSKNVIWNSWRLPYPFNAIDHRGDPGAIELVFNYDTQQIQNHNNVEYSVKFYYEDIFKNIYVKNIKIKGAQIEEFQEELVEEAIIT